MYNIYSRILFNIIIYCELLRTLNTHAHTSVNHLLIALDLEKQILQKRQLTQRRFTLIALRRAIYRIQYEYVYGGGFVSCGDRLVHRSDQSAKAMATAVSDS